MEERFVFDAAGVEALEAGDREWRAWDEALPGFGVRIRPSGTKSWIVRARTRGADGKVRRQRVTIGRCGEMGLEEARAEARRLMGAGAAAVEGLPAAGVVDRATRGGGDGPGDGAPKTDIGGCAAAGSPAEDDGVRPKSAAADGRAAAGGDRPGAEAAADLAQKLDGLRGVADRIEAGMAKMGPQMETLSGSAALMAGDRRRGRRRWVQTVLVVVAMFALGAASGGAVQYRFELVPPPDPSLGWKDHVWNHYGKAFMECFQRAKETESGWTDCRMKVRGR